MRIDELPKSDRIEDRRGGLKWHTGGRGGLVSGTIVVLGLRRKLYLRRLARTPSRRLAAPLRKPRADLAVPAHQKPARARARSLRRKGCPHQSG
jgi:hypothetical protein